jgi:Tfp pilus assembly protein PilF/cold shock CspA family protein
MGTYFEGQENSSRTSHLITSTLMPTYSVSRLTLFAVISALERDLRELVLDSLDPQLSMEELFAENDELFLKMQKRHRDDPESVSESAGPTARDLLAYSDFSDSNQLLQVHRKSLPTVVQNQVGTINATVQALAPIRNRVMHTRPLHFDDLAQTLDRVDELLERNRTLFPHVQTMLKQLQEEPSSVLSLEVPQNSDVEAVSHNLPIPDFDETGFIGRDEQLIRLRELCRGPYPVITIVGEGGIGKTALVLRIAYEALDFSPQQFDAVVWTTAKSTMITTKQIIEIEGAISDSLGLLNVASAALAGTTRTVDPLGELIEYLGTFRILLILDNLETVLDERLRSFLARLPQGSKILITSRVGVGAYEYPMKLDPLSNHEAVQLLRALTKTRGLTGLLRVSNQIVSGYCQRMKNNPGYIKWFVSAVQAGSRPEEILADPSLFLEFCMSNVYNFLSNESRKTLQTMQYISGARSQAELAFLSTLDSLSLQRSVTQLLATNMVDMVPVAKGSSFQSTYELSELAREYLTRRHPIPGDVARALQTRRRELAEYTGNLFEGRRTYPYSPRTIHVRSQSDYIIAKYLADAMGAIDAGDWEKANTLIAEAKRLAPEFYEVHRVEAFLRISQDDFSAAATCYEAAIEIEPNSAPLRLWYGGFLLRYVDNAQGALEELTKAAEVDSTAPEIQTELAATYLSIGDFDRVESIMRSLLNRVISSERLKKRIFDLMLQVYQRKAERSTRGSDYMRAVDLLQGLKNAFESIPIALVDQQMLQKLSRARGSAIMCKKRITDPSYRRTASDLDAWFASKANASAAATPEGVQAELHGQITRWWPEKRFGFIVGSSGQEYFFHYNSVISQHELQDVHAGCTVVFAIGKDIRGNRAENVEIVDLLEIA